MEALAVKPKTFSPAAVKKANEQTDLDDREFHEIMSLVDLPSPPSAEPQRAVVVVTDEEAPLPSHAKPPHPPMEPGPLPTSGSAGVLGFNTALNPPQPPNVPQPQPQPQPRKQQQQQQQSLPQSLPTTVLCAHCSKPVDIVKGLLGQHYKQLVVCDCYVHLPCLAESKGLISCGNCVCQVCDQPGKMVLRGSLTEKLELRAEYPQNLSKCGCKAHRSCYETLVMKSGGNQERGLYECGYSKCIMCLSSQFAMDNYPPILGPNYMKNNSKRELALYRSRCPFVSSVTSTATPKPEQQQQQQPPRPSQLGAGESPWKTKLGLASPQKQAPPPQTPPKLTVSEMLEQGMMIIPNDVPAEDGSVPFQSGSKALIFTESLGHRLYNSRLSLRDYINAGFTLHDFSHHLSPSQFFRRFFDITIIVKYLPENPSATELGCSGQRLLHAWKRHPGGSGGVMMSDLFEGIKGNFQHAPTEGSGKSPLTKITVQDLVTLGITYQDLIDGELKIDHVVGTPSMEAWKIHYPELVVTSLTDWQKHHKVLLTAQMITVDQALDASNFLTSQSYMWRALGTVGSYLPPHLQSGSNNQGHQQQQQPQPQMPSPQTMTPYEVYLQKKMVMEAAGGGGGGGYHTTPNSNPAGNLTNLNSSPQRTQTYVPPALRIPAAQPQLFNPKMNINPVMVKPQIIQPQPNPVPTAQKITTTTTTTWSSIK